MKKFAGLLTTLTLTVSAVGTAQATTILKTDTFGGNNYYLIGDNSGSRLTWSDAQNAALAMGGDLVTVNDAAENAFLLNAFGASALAAAPLGGGLVSLWLGLNDAAQEGQFVWADGAPVSYTNWVPGEPAGNVADEDFAGMIVGPGFGIPGQWHDIVADFRFNDVTFGVVEITPAAVSEPGSLALLGLGLGGLGWMRRRTPLNHRADLPKLT